jgi:hypothetical protein
MPKLSATPFVIKIIQMAQILSNDVKLHRTPIESLLKVVCDLHREGQYSTQQMEAAPSVSVRGFKHMKSKGKVVPICCHLYPCVMHNVNDVCVGKTLSQFFMEITSLFPSYRTFLMDWM